jgi:hypothetical protein
VGLSQGQTDRVFLTLLANRQLVGFAKVSRSAEPLNRERLVLETLAHEKLHSFSIPRPISMFSWHELTVLLLEPINVRGLAARTLTGSEYAVLEELSGLGRVLEPVLGDLEGLVPVHGDFAPWNTGRTRAGYFVWDWEDARLGLPLEDFFHWHLQLLVLFGAGSADGLARMAVSPGSEVSSFYERLGVDLADASKALRTCLERRVPELLPGSSIRQALESALELLPTEPR